MFIAYQEQIIYIYIHPRRIVEHHVGISRPVRMVAHMAKAFLSFNELVHSIVIVIVHDEQLGTRPPT